MEPIRTKDGNVLTPLSSSEYEKHNQLSKILVNTTVTSAFSNDFTQNNFPQIEPSGLNEMKKINQNLVIAEKQRDDAYIQLRQANDKISSQTSRIARLEADLKDEINRREQIEAKASAEEWKKNGIALLLTILGGIITLIIEHTYFL